MLLQKCTEVYWCKSPHDVTCLPDNVGTRAGEALGGISELICRELTFKGEAIGYRVRIA
jgi:hypothetical protein